jgi:hypothetical protein
MLTIKVNHKNLVLNPDFSLKLTYSNPVCYFDEVPGAYGIGIEIPNNPHNRAILGNPERFAKFTPDKTSRKFTGTTIRFSGVLLLSGALVITSADKESYSAWLQSDLGVLGEDQREKFITDLDWPTEVPFRNGTQSEFDDTTDIYGLRTVMNRIFWDGKGKEAEYPVTYTDEDGDIQTKMETQTVLTAEFRKNSFYNVNALNPDLTVITDKVGCVVSPFLYLRFAIKEALRLNKFFIDRNDMNVDDELLSLLNPLKNLMVYNNFNIMKQILTTKLETIWIYSNELFMYIPVGVKEITEIEWDINTFDTKNLLPKIKLKDFILDIQNFLNFAFHFKDDNTLDIVDREKVIDQNPIDIDKYHVGQWHTGDQSDVTLKFISGYDSDDAMFGDDFHDLSHRLSDYGDMVETYEELLEIVDPQIGEIRIVRKENRVYEYKWQIISTEDLLRYEEQIDALGWEFIANGPQPFHFGDSPEIEEINTGLSTPSRRSGDVGFSWNHVVMQKGNVELSKTAWNDFTFRLMTYGDVFNSTALNWEGELGLFKRRWKNFAPFWKNRLPISGEFRFPVSVLSFVKKNITSKFMTREGTFLIKDIEVDISLYHIGVTKIEGFKL